MATYRCVICTPTAKLFDEDVTYASLPSEDGMFGVLPGHELLVALTGQGGVCTVDAGESGSDKRQFLVFKGASQMFHGILTILASFGIETKDINREECIKHKAICEEHIAATGDKDDAQSKATRAVWKRQMEWDDFQLAYLDGKAA